MTTLCTHTHTKSKPHRALRRCCRSAGALERALRCQSLLRQAGVQLPHQLLGRFLGNTMRRHERPPMLMDAHAQRRRDVDRRQSVGHARSCRAVSLPDTSAESLASAENQWGTDAQDTWAPQPQLAPAQRVNLINDKTALAGELAPP